MKFLIAFLLFATTATAQVSSVYDFSFTTTEGQSHTLREYQGKKILLVILPVTQTAEDSAFLKRIDSLGTAHSGVLAIIGIPSYEDGYNESLSANAQAFYRALLDTGVLITRGMYTHQSSGSSQDTLFNWLTHASGNTHFEEEVKGTCEMYYLSEAGELKGVMGPEAKFSNRVLQAMFN